jgi:hypothetical protein
VTRRTRPVKLWTVFERAWAERAERPRAARSLDARNQRRVEGGNTRRVCNGWVASRQAGPRHHRGDRQPWATHLLERAEQSRRLERLRRAHSRCRCPEFAAQGSSPSKGRSDGGGRMDLLLDGWLNVELDGDEWHDAKHDRARDSLPVRRGYRSHRFGFDQVVLDYIRRRDRIVLHLRGGVGASEARKRGPASRRRVPQSEQR